MPLVVWREGGEVLVGYNDPRDLAKTYDLGAQAATLEQPAALLGRPAGELSRYS